MFLKLVCSALLLAAALAEVAVHRPCPNEPQEACRVTEVRVNPCRNPASCKLTKGENATIAFDFTPNFSASSLTASLSWPSPAGDVPFPELYEVEACGLTSCSVESGKSQELNYRLMISKKLPTGPYDFKWRLWNTADRDQMCCFITKVQLAKPKRT